MSMLIARLKAYGADMDGAMSRFLDDEELYASCFVSFLDDPCFSALGHALETGNYTEAFDAAHTLKGVAGNMGLSPIYDSICNLVTPLRSNDYTNLQPLYAEVMAQYQSLKEIQL